MTFLPASAMETARLATATLLPSPCTQLVMTSERMPSSTLRNSRLVRTMRNASAACPSGWASVTSVFSLISRREMRGMRPRVGTRSA